MKRIANISKCMFWLPWRNCCPVWVLFFLFFAVSDRGCDQHCAAVDWGRTETKGRDSLLRVFGRAGVCMHRFSLWLGSEVRWIFFHVITKKIFITNALFSLSSPALHAMSLPTLSCSYCMRKVGLWNFLQIEGLGGDTEVLPNLVGSSGPTAGPASAASDGDASESVSPTPAPTTPCRMKLRSQDSTRTDQASSQEARRSKLFDLCIH